MSCIAEILKSIQENRKDETAFDYDGDEYENWYGKYTRNRQPISKEEYHKARKALIAHKYKDGTLEKEVQQPHQDYANEVEELYNFVDSLEYDKDYQTFKSTREGHLPKIDLNDKEKRIEQIVVDTAMSKEDAEVVNDIIVEYTSTNNYSQFNPEDRGFLDEFIDLSPAYMPPPVYRGLGFRDKLGYDDPYGYYKELANLEEGAFITFRDYASFTSSIDIAIEFAHSHGDKYAYIVNTKNLTGVSIDHLSSTDFEEEELIYRADVIMRLKEKIIKDGIIYLHVEEASLDEDDYDEDNIFEIADFGSMYIKK